MSNRPPIDFHDLVQLATVAAIIAGVALVVWELQQARDLTRLQVMSDGFLANRSNAIALSGEEPSEILARACDSPDALTTRDFLILSYVYSEALDSMNRLQVLEAGLYPEDTWQTFVPARFGPIFATEAGRAWWEQRAIGINEGIRAYVDDYLASLGPPDCQDSVAAWRSRTLDLMDIQERNAP